MPDELDHLIYEVAVAADVRGDLICHMCATSFVDGPDARLDKQIHFLRNHHNRGPGIADFQSGESYMRRRHKIFRELDNDARLDDMRRLSDELATEP